jgi:hypothetical protein
MYTDNNMFKLINSFTFVSLNKSDQARTACSEAVKQRNRKAKLHQISIPTALNNLLKINHINYSLNLHSTGVTKNTK